MFLVRAIRGGVLMIFFVLRWDNKTRDGALGTRRVESYGTYVWGHDGQRRQSCPRGHSRPRLCPNRERQNRRMNEAVGIEWAR